MLASGQVINANAQQHSDLWLALKGGGNKFGIETRFDLAAFPQGNFWGGQVLYDDSTSSQLLSAFAELNVDNYDEYAALILSFSYVQPLSGFISSASIKYSKAITNPPTFQSFATIPHLSSILRISNLTDFTTEFVVNQPNGQRYDSLTNGTNEY